MKRTRRFPQLAGALAGLLMLWPASLAPVAANQDQALRVELLGQRDACCDRMTARAQGVATGPTTFTTAVDLTISGRQGGPAGNRTYVSTSTATLLTQSTAADGTITGVSSHVFEMNGYSDGDGQCEPGELCFTTLDRPVLTPTQQPGVYRLDSTLAVVSGHNAFTNLCGQIKVTADGEIDFTATPPTVRWRAAGDLCQCTP